MYRTSIDAHLPINPDLNFHVHSTLFSFLDSLIFYTVIQIKPTNICSNSKMESLSKKDRLLTEQSRWLKLKDFVMYTAMNRIHLCFQVVTKIHTLLYKFSVYLRKQCFGKITTKKHGAYSFKTLLRTRAKQYQTIKMNFINTFYINPNCDRFYFEEIYHLESEFSDGFF